MAHSKASWQKAKVYFEAGKPLSYIQDTLDIDKATISRKAKKDNWVKSKTQRLKDDIIEHEEKNATILQQKTTLRREVAKLEDYECIILDELIQDEKSIRSLIFSSTALNVIRVNEDLKANQKYEKLNVGDGIQNLEPVKLGSADYKNHQDTLDKASITLKVNERFNTTPTTQIQNANINQGKPEIEGYSVETIEN